MDLQLTDYHTVGFPNVGCRRHVCLKASVSCLLSEFNVDDPTDLKLFVIVISGRDNGEAILAMAVTVVGVKNVVVIERWCTYCRIVSANQTPGSLVKKPSFLARGSEPKIG